MKYSLYAGVAALALSAGMATAGGHLAFGTDGGPFSWDSYNAYKDSAPDLSGQSITVSGPWLSPEDGYFDNMLAYFEEATGADVSYVGSDSFEQNIVIDAEAGAAPNIAVFPQPGLAADLASRGLLAPLPAGMGDWVAENYGAGQSWVDLGTYADANGDDQLFGFFYNVNVKSLVWYNPENFEDAGYEVPTTMEGLKALTEQIVSEGETPWCIGLGSGAATGWPATDWVEDMMLRTVSPEDYDAWTTNELPFNDPKVIAAIEGGARCFVNIFGHRVVGYTFYSRQSVPIRGVGETRAPSWALRNSRKAAMSLASNAFASNGSTARSGRSRAANSRWTSASSSWRSAILAAPRPKRRFRNSRNN